MFIKRAIQGCEDLIRNGPRNYASLKADAVASTASDSLALLQKAHPIHIPDALELMTAIEESRTEGLIEMVNNRPGLPFPVVWIDFPASQEYGGGDIGGLLVEELELTEEKRTKRIRIGTFLTQKHKRMPILRDVKSFFPNFISWNEYDFISGKLYTNVDNKMSKDSGAIKEAKHSGELDVRLISSLIIALYSKRIVLVNKKQKVKNKSRKRRIKGMKTSDWGVCEYKILSIKLNEEQKRYIGTSDDTVPFGSVGVHWKMKRERVYQSDENGKGGLFGGPWSGTLTDECIYINKDQSPVKKFIYQDRHIKV